ncbi:polyphosphate:AMP phosphotransferase [Kiritimatiellota bacterium B12222]|nr:polyphosphate:AMP phosphotransferase [Kiritimatiellota bacterium B12222]
MTQFKEIWEDVLSQPKVSKQEFKEAEPEIRRELVELQQELRNSKVSVMMVFAGVDGAGKHEMVNTLNSWMDPRGIITHAYAAEDLEATQHSPFWKYWRDIPAIGQLGLFLSAWYSKPLLGRVHRRMSEKDFKEHLKEISEFERTMTDNGILVVKVWMHMDKKAQLKRLNELSSKPDTEWEIKPGAWENWGMYDRFIEASTKIIRASDKAGIPWLLVNGKHRYARQLTVARALRDAMRHRLQNPPVDNSLTPTEWDKKMSPTRGSLRKMDLTKSLEKSEYKTKLKALRVRLYQLQHKAQLAGLSTVLVFEGQDAAGKGGAIRRLVQGLDAQQYQVVPIAAPTKAELAHHYLWRFWQHLPRKGRVTIFDRSWYGRVLVERVEGFATDAEWQRAYQEINEFEQQLINSNYVVCKFWIQIDKEMQLARFEERQNTPYKEWKITDEDWRNREKWDVYDVAVDDMISLTHHKQAPWVLVEGNDKSWSRIKVLETVCQQLEKALKTHT